MSLSKSFILCLLFVLSPIISIPFGYAESVTPSTAFNSYSVESPPPVEKVKPVEKKKKKKKRLKKRQKRNKKHPSASKNNNGTTALILFLLLLLLIGGAVIFGVGINIFALWLTGLIIISVALLASLIFMFVNEFTTGGFWDTIFSALALGFVIIAGLIINFIIGLIFFIWGLIISNPIGWIVGLIMMLIAIAVLIWMIFSLDS